MLDLDPRPTVDEWTAKHSELRRNGSEWEGPCPVCGGTDRFHINRRGIVGCRGCIDGQPEADRARAYGAIMRAVFPERFDLPDSKARNGISRVIRDQRHVQSRVQSSTSSTRETATKHKTDTVTILREPDPRAVEAWARARPADGTTAHVYLARRWAWPEEGAELPAAIRWLPLADIPHGMGRRPKGAAGAIAYRFERPDGKLAGVQLDALDADGRTISPRWRKTAGTVTGALFTASKGEGERPPIVIVEGPIDALACRWKYPGARSVATGGRNGLDRITPSTIGRPDGRGVVIEADGGDAGQEAARTARKRLPGARAIFRMTDGGDVADEIADAVRGRASIMEFDAGMDRASANRAAWTDLETQRPDR